MNRYVFFLFCVSFFLVIPFLYKKTTHGFRVNKLYVAPLGSDHFEGDKTLLNQPFYYLNRGMQFFVFESQDGEIVLKFFKKSRRGREKLQKTFQACRLAFELAQEETGLLALHLSSTSGELPRITIKDRLGISYSLPLDRYAFVIQKKAKPFYKTFAKAWQEGTAETLIDSYLDLISKRSAKGICNSDYVIKNNLGVLGSKVVEIDFGNYFYSPENREKEFRLFASRLRRSLKTDHPEYLPIYDRKVAEFL